MQCFVVGIFSLTGVPAPSTQNLYKA